MVEKILWKKIERKKKKAKIFFLHRKLGFCIVVDKKVKRQRI